MSAQARSKSASTASLSPHPCRSGTWSANAGRASRYLATCCSTTGNRNPSKMIARVTDGMSTTFACRKPSTARDTSSASWPPVSGVPASVDGAAAPTASRSSRSCRWKPAGSTPSCGTARRRRRSAGKATVISRRSSARGVPCCAANACSKWPSVYCKPHWLTTRRSSGEGGGHAASSRIRYLTARARPNVCRDSSEKRPLATKITLVAMLRPSTFTIE
mmetsp:Transcript_42327/g.134489  ORF Transcript_42327/g.134489 Transcript_42327/m.134489 type:complete len:219 (-) Transcript_42327:23-679(-)